VGAPRLERNVHVGPGATILGPIVVGEGTKIQAGALLTTSVPARSLVLAPRSEIRGRDRTPAENEAGAEAAPVRALPRS
jgi:serine O-acetyltransferase